MAKVKEKKAAPVRYGKQGEEHYCKVVDYNTKAQQGPEVQDGNGAVEYVQVENGSSK